jgi:hypothetical protein
VDWIHLAQDGVKCLASYEQGNVALGSVKVDEYLEQVKVT